eukprot:SAG31_NODE_12890_length_908_cov_1.828183_1_plen_114_part_00
MHPTWKSAEHFEIDSAPLTKALSSDTTPEVRAQLVADLTRHAIGARICVCCSAVARQQTQCFPFHIFNSLHGAALLECYKVTSNSLTKAASHADLRTVMAAGEGTEFDAYKKV